MKEIKEKKKKPNLNSKVGKYYLAVQKGKTKKEAQIVAGYNSVNNVTQIEKSKSFGEIQRYFKDEFMDRTTLGELSDELLKNIKQDKDRGAKNKAIELALNRVEPLTKVVTEDDKVIVILA